MEEAGLGGICFGCFKQSYAFVLNSWALKQRGNEKTWMLEWRQLVDERPSNRNQNEPVLISNRYSCRRVLEHIV